LTDITINDSVSALDNVDGLIIARPRSIFSEKDLYIIDQFVMRGGRLMCFIDALKIDEDTLNAKGATHSIRYNLGVDRMLFDYGLKLNDNFVIDAQCAPKVVPLAKQSLIPWFFHVLATPSKHPIARNLEFVSLKYASEVQFVGKDKNVLTPILTSSSNSTRTGMAPMVNLGMALNYGKNPELVPNPTDKSNQICLAGLAEGSFESHYKNRIVDEYANNPIAKYKERSIKEGKVLLVGNGRFLENKYDSMPSRDGKNIMYRPTQINDLRFDPKLAEIGLQHSFGNQEFIQNLVDYMMGENSVIDIRSRQIDVHGINNEKIKADAGFYKIMNLLIPCGIILLLAFVMHYLRKRKYSR
jgi:gliding-associated putative ABC transporter substrate-binding component GldG